MTMTLTQESIQKFIDEKIAPGVASHGGSVDIERLEDRVLTIKLAGACGSCSVQAYTAESISDFVLNEFSELDDVVVIDQ